MKRSIIRFFYIATVIIVFFKSQVFAQLVRIEVTVNGCVRTRSVCIDPETPYYASRHNISVQLIQNGNLLASSEEPQGGTEVQCANLNIMHDANATNFRSFNINSSWSVIIENGNGTSCNLNARSDDWQFLYDGSDRYQKSFSLPYDPNYSLTASVVVTKLSVPAPVVSFTHSTGVCSTTTTFSPSFTYSDPNCALTYNWRFGDGATSTEKEPSHTYVGPGTYSVSLDLGYQCPGNNNGVISVTNQNTVVACPPPQASFTQSTDVCSRTSTFSPSFIYGATNCVLTYYWRFGDGATSTERNPAHSYAAPGTYSVSLDLGYQCSGNNSGVVTVTNQNTIEAPGQKILVKVTVTSEMKTRSECIDHPVPYTASNSIGAELLDVNKNVYKSATDHSSTDAFTKTLIQYETESSSNQFHIWADGRIRIEVTDGRSCVPSYFISRSNPWEVNYDGSNSFKVSLTYGVSPWDPDYTFRIDVDITKLSSTICPEPIEPISSNIYSSNDYGCGTQFRLFANFGKRDCRPTDYQWNFGDGQTSTESAPFHTYSGVGTYTVTLKYKFSCNAPSLVNEVTVTRQVTVTSALSSKLDFTIQNSLCGTTFTALPIYPDNTCSNVAYEWDFGDNTPKSTLPSPSHLYARGGSFNVSLKLTYSCSGCQKFITYNKNVVVPEPPPIASFTQQINSCTATFNSVFFQSPSCTIQTYNWDFGDGTTSTVANPVHTYASAGTYSTSLAVAYTCGSTCSGQVIVTKPTIIVAPEAPTVDFTTQKYACEINFTPSIIHKNRTCSTVSYLWNFGDGTTSAESNPAHLYTGAGTYSASLTVTYQCVNTCPAQASVTVSKTIILDAPPTATVDFNFSNYYCATKFSPATNYSSNTCRSVSYLWNFGDGATSNDRSPLHAYANPGSYNVSLKLFYQCNNGCPAEINVSKQITYTSLPAQLQDMLIQVETDVKKQVITASAVTFSDVWPLSHDNAALGNRNSYLNGTQGVWRNNASYAYDTARLQSPTINVAKDGTFPMNQFDWGSANFNVVPNWIQANTMTQYSPYSYELENQDVLGVYSAALYDYGGHLPSANGVNMRNAEMAFTSFEFIEVDINGNPTGKPSGNWMLRNIDQPATNIYKVPIGIANAAVIEASVEELEFVQRVDVSAETLNFLFPSFFNAYFLPYAKSFNHLQDVEVLCKQVHPTNPKWSIIVLAKAPFEGVWSGKITVKRTARKAVNAVLGTVAHSGNKSLKVTSILPPEQLNFRQEMLQLEQGKTYWVNVWVSVENANRSIPKLADNLGIELTFLNRQQQPISTVSFQPVGTIIEGWQQIKGTFISPIKNPLVEIKFKPGSTGTAYYDDLRLQPEKGNMKAYVYDIKDYRLRAILDEENYASFFYYDAEGNLYLTKKETEKGTKTITENVSYQVERR